MSAISFPRGLCWLLGCGLYLALSSGCGLPTWTELIGSKPEEPPVYIPPPKPPVVIPTKPVEPPPKPNAAEIVGKFRELRAFQIDDQALASVLTLDEGLEAITELSLSGSPATNKGIAQLGKLTHLAKLDVQNSNIDRAGCEAIAQATSLEELRFDGSELDEAAVVSLRPLSNLKVLDLRGVQLTPAGFAELLHHRQLVELDLRHSSMDDQSLNIVADLPELERLTLAHTRVTDDGIARLAKLDKLVYLDLWGCAVTGRAFGVIAKASGLKSLKVLNLTQTQLNTIGANSVKQMTNIEDMGLGYLDTMQDIHLASMIRGMTQLKQLHLMSSKLLTSQSMQAVRNHKHLEYLNLSDCPRVDDSVFNHLLTCKNLKTVNLAHTNCTASAAKKFKDDFLPECKIVGLEGN